MRIRLFNQFHVNLAPFVLTGHFVALVVCVATTSNSKSNLHTIRAKQKQVELFRGLSYSLAGLIDSNGGDDVRDLNNLSMRVHEETWLRNIDQNGIVLSNAVDYQPTTEADARKKKTVDYGVKFTWEDIRTVEPSKTVVTIRFRHKLTESVSVYWHDSLPDTQLPSRKTDFALILFGSASQARKAASLLSSLRRSAPFAQTHGESRGNRPRFEELAVRTVNICQRQKTESQTSDGKGKNSSTQTLDLDSINQSRMVISSKNDHEYEDTTVRNVTMKYTVSWDNIQSLAADRYLLHIRLKSPIDYQMEIVSSGDDSQKQRISTHSTKEIELLLSSGEDVLKLRDCLKDLMEVS